MFILKELKIPFKAKKWFENVDESNDKRIVIIIFLDSSYKDGDACFIKEP